MNYGQNEMNFTCLDGHLVKDPEQRGGEKGPVVLRVANENRRKNKESQEWDVFYDNFDVTVWGALRERALTYKEGDRVMVQGRLKRDSYTKDDKKVYQTIINVENLALIGESNGAGKSTESDSGDFQF